MILMSVAFLPRLIELIEVGASLKKYKGEFEQDEFMNIWFLLYNFIPLYIGFVIKFLNVTIRVVRIALDIWWIVFSRIIKVWSLDSDF